MFLRDRDKGQGRLGMIEVKEKGKGIQELIGDVECALARRAKKLEAKGFTKKSVGMILKDNRKALEILRKRYLADSKDKAK